MPAILILACGKVQAEQRMTLSESRQGGEKSETNFPEPRNQKCVGVKCCLKGNEFLADHSIRLGWNNLRLGILLAFACMPGHERIKIKFGYTSTGWWEVEPDPVIKREEPHWQAIKSKLYENGEQILNGLACSGWCREIGCPFPRRTTFVRSFVARRVKAKNRSVTRM